MKKQEQNTKETVSMLVYGYLVILFAAVYAEQAGDDRKCKIFVFPEYYAGAGGFCGAGCAVAEDPGRTDNETDVEENGCVYAVVSGVCNLFLWNQSLQGGCPFRVSRLVYGAGDPGIAGGDLFCGIPVL